jgi:hypothetical protein
MRAGAKEGAMQPLYDKTYHQAPFGPALDPKAALTQPMQLLDDTYGELFRHEINTSQKAWMQMVADFQQLSTRWVARRQEMLRDSALLLQPDSLAKPGDVANVWWRWASNSAQRVIDDMSDQLEVTLRAATRMSEVFEAPTQAAATRRPPASRVHARATVKTKRARKPNGDTAH